MLQACLLLRTVAKCIPNPKLYTILTWTLLGTSDIKTKTVSWRQLATSIAKFCQASTRSDWLS